MVAPALVNNADAGATVYITGIYIAVLDCTIEC
jgi:hypothetical protein